MSKVDFENARVGNLARLNMRSARGLLLKKLKDNFNKKKQEEEQQWRARENRRLMLHSVEGRLETEAQKMKKDKKKRKKEKKEKKKKKRERRSSSSSSSSSEDEQWVEKNSVPGPSGKDPVKPAATPGSSKERDEWMSVPGLFPSVTRDELRQKSRTKSETELKREKDKYMMDTLGQSDRELNPYWKDGGCGLPQTELQSGSVNLATKAVGDGGADWLRRALERAKQQAADQGRSLEEVAAERWGSLEKLKSLIDEAENRRPARPDRKDQDYSRGRGQFRKPKSDEYSSSWSREEHSNFRKPRIDESSSSHRSYIYSRPGPKNWKKDSSNQQRSEEPPRSRRRTPSSSSSSSSDEEEKKEPPAREEAPAAVLTDKELNELGAKLVKAELMGNDDLAAQLKKKLDAARAAKKDAPSSSKQGGKQEEEVVILTRTDNKGFVRPLDQPAYPEPSGGRRKKQKVATHAEGKRVRYFADDDKYSLKEMFQQEKMSTAEDQNEAFARMAAKGAGRPDSEYDLDDVFVERARMKESDGKTQARERDRAIKEHKRTEKILENCSRCYNSKETKKHLIVSTGSKAYLCVPPYQSLTTGHCFIVPMFHVPCGTQLDEDVWAEIQSYRRALTTMFYKMGQDVVFFETAKHVNNFPHMAVECVPVPKEIGDQAPIYFKKAILECETEWSNNKKLVNLNRTDVRRAIPKGLPYFAVDFGMDGGYAHVIEDEKLFPQNFAEEIIGGMMDLDHSLWRKQRPDPLDVVCKKVLSFVCWWKPYDFTRREPNAD